MIEGIIWWFNGMLGVMWTVESSCWCGSFVSGILQLFFETPWWYFIAEGMIWLNGLVSLVFQNIKLLKYTCRIDRKLKPDPKNIGYASWTCCDYALKNAPLQCSTYRAVLIMWDHYLISVSQQNFEEKNDVFLWWIRDLSEKPTKKWPTKASNGDKSKLARHELPNSQAWNPSESLRDLWEAYRYPSDLGKSHGNFPWIFSNLKHSQAIGWVNPDYWASYPRIDKIVIKYDQVLISPEIDYVTFKIWEKKLGLRFVPQYIVFLK